MGTTRARRGKRCGWGGDFTIISCNLPMDHEGPHHIPSDPSMPQRLTRAEQEDHNERMKGRVLGQTPRHRS